MKAIVYTTYGTPDVLRLTDVDTPAVGSGGVLVRVRAAALNPVDWHMLRGVPYAMRVTTGLRRPKRQITGADAAGSVEAVGSGVTRLRPGDEVFGMRRGSVAEYVLGDEECFVPKPAGLTFEQAAALPLAGLTALQSLRDRGRVAARQRVLVNGAAGGIGTLAVQIAKHYGAEVTGVCSTANVELVRSLGADGVVDYTRADFADGSYDLILDVVGNRSDADIVRALAPGGTAVLVGGGGLEDSDGKLLGPVAGGLRVLLHSKRGDKRLRTFLTKVGRNDLLTLKELVEGGQLRPVVDRVYPFAEAAEAMRHLETGHARGKVVVTIAQ